MTDQSDLNADLALRACIDTPGMDWQPSPSPTVWRKRLHHSGSVEGGVVTSLVRFDPNSSFPMHPHPGGEEILVLEGTFSDGTGDYPAGTYILNPEGFSHAPSSADGCVLFVKLRQYGGAGRERVVIDTNAMEWQPAGPPGLWAKPLYRQEGFPETVRMVRAEPGTRPWPHTHPDGEEVFVIEGELHDEDGAYRAGTWRRDPAGTAHAPWSDTGCRMLVRTGIMEPVR